MTNVAHQTYLPDNDGVLDIGDGAMAPKFVAFKVGPHDLCVDISRVLEIRAWTGTTSLPNTPDFVLGVINLRGIIVPVIDLSARFGQGNAEPTPSHVIVITDVGGERVGLLVDAVIDIVSVPADSIVAIPELQSSQGNQFLTGLIEHGEDMVAVISLDHVVDTKSLPGQIDLGTVPRESANAGTAERSGKEAARTEGAPDTAQ